MKRFWNKVNKDGPICERLGTACWVWTASTDSAGYGYIGIKYRLVGAHRVSWFLANGKIPTGKLVLHECDNKPCVNPAHLYIGDHHINMMDAIKRGLVPSIKRKLSDEEATYCRTNYKEGDRIFGLRALARKFHVDKRTIRNAMRRSVTRPACCRLSQVRRNGECGLPT